MINNCFECTKPYKTSHKRRKFCSKKCYLADRIRKHFVPKTAFKKGICPPTAWKKGCPAPPTAFKKGFVPWHKGKKCPNLSRENHYNWKGGKWRLPSGYIQVMNKEHQFSNVRGYVLEHRLVMEKHIGRYLTTEEVVHHINGIVDDNKKENLELIATNSEHSRLHSIKRKRNIHGRWCKVCR